MRSLDELSIITRLLNLSDLPQIQEIYRSRSQHMGVYIPDYYESHCDHLLIDEYLNENFSQKQMYGTFWKGRLVLCMGVYFWKELPSCTFLRFASLQGAFQGREIRDPFRSLYDACLTELEERGYNRFYILSSAKHHEVLALVGATWDRLRNHYMMTLEEVVPANSKPRFDFVWNMMGRRVWQVPITVRAGTLLNKYRKFDSGFVSSRAMQIWDETGCE